MGEISFWCTISIGTNPTYAPGDSMTVSGSLLLETDAGYGGSDEGDCDGAYNSTFDAGNPPPGLFFVNTGNLGSPTFVGSGDIYTLPFSFSLTAPASAGTHTLGTRQTLSYYWYGFPGHTLHTQDYDTDVGGLSFDVVPATPPAVNLNFSAILDSAKQSLTSVIVALKESVIGVAEAKTR
jgi:hypothetical protein